MHTHLLAVADALLFEAQFPLQVLDDGILGSLNVRIGDGARGLGARGLLGERFAEETKQKRRSASVMHGRYLRPPFLCGPHSSRVTSNPSIPGVSYLSPVQEECQDERGGREPQMKNDQS